MLFSVFRKDPEFSEKNKPGTSLGDWIRRIMINTSIDFYRKNIRRRTEDLDKAQHQTSSDIDPISNCSAKEILLSVQKLSPAYRAVFNLYAIEGYSHKEIAEKLKISPGTSKSQLNRARKLLQKKLQEISIYESIPLSGVNK